MITVAEVDEARVEILSKTTKDIEDETGRKWGARALAAYVLYQETGKLQFFAVATGYHHEAVEHSGEGNPGTLEKVKAQLETSLRAILCTGCGNSR